MSSRTTPIEGAATASRIPYGVPQTGARIAQFGGQASIIALICLSILAPPIRFSETFPFLKAEQILLPVIILFYMWFLLAGYARPIRFNGMFIVGAVYSVCFAISTWYGASLLHHSVELRDFYEIPKVLFPVVFFTVAYEAELPERALRRLIGFYSAAVLLACLYAWAQFANLGIANLLNPYYSGGEHIDLVLLYAGRVYSTMANPNVLGQLMSWSIPVFALAILLRVGNRIWNICMIAACLITLAMTASRYGVLTSTLGIALTFVIAPRFVRRRAGQLALLLLVLPLFAWTLRSIAVANPVAGQRFLSLSQPLQTDSARGRFDITWPEALTDFARSPFIGNGPAKTYFGEIPTDSEYLDVLKEFGIIGLLVYLAYYALPLAYVWRGIRVSERGSCRGEERLPATSLVMRASFIMIVLALVMNFGESTFYNLLMQSFLWLWIGLGVRAAETFSGQPQ